MSLIGSGITGAHKTQLYSDVIHATVVLVVVTAVSVLAAAQVGLPPDVIGTVYGGAIGYAAGRAGSVTRGPIVLHGSSSGTTDVDRVEEVLDDRTP